MTNNLKEPFWINGDFKWYRDEKTQEFLSSKNDHNLPPLKNLHCCIVINEKEGVSDYVLLDEKQNIICAYDYPNQYHEYETKIKMLKIIEHYDEHERNNNVQ